MSGRRKAPANTYWRGNVLWGRITVANREFKWSLRTSDAGVAKRRVKAQRERLIGETHFGERRHSYPDVFAEWSQHIVTQVSETTASRYAGSLKMLEDDLLPIFIDEIDKARCQAIVKRRREQGISIATIRRDLTALSSVIEFAIDKEWREGNPALDCLRKLKERRDPIVLPQAAHIDRVILRASDALGNIAKAARLTGCRQNELQYAERVNFDRGRRQLRVRGKGNKYRTISLGLEASAHLASLPVSLGCKWLFWHSEGEPYRNVASAFRKVVHAEMAAAQKTAQQEGLSEPDFRVFTFHHLRHYFAVEWLKEGRSIYDLQQHLGHTSIKTTEMYLEFLTSDEKRRVKLGSAQTAAQEHGFDEARTA